MLVALSADDDVLSALTNLSSGVKVMTKCILALALSMGVISPALADFYIVRGPDKKCKVVETRPTDKTIVVIGDKGYVTKAEAEKQVTVVCK